MNFDVLPSDILISIFLQLNGIDVLSLCLVSKRFCQLFQSKKYSSLISGSNKRWYGYFCDKEIKYSEIYKRLNENYGDLYSVDSYGNISFMESGIRNVYEYGCLYVIDYDYNLRCKYRMSPLTSIDEFVIYKLKNDIIGKNIKMLNISYTNIPSTMLQNNGNMYSIDSEGIKYIGENVSWIDSNHERYYLSENILYKDGNVKIMEDVKYFVSRDVLYILSNDNCLYEWEDGILTEIMKCKTKVKTFSMTRLNDGYIICLVNENGCNDTFMMDLDYKIINTRIGGGEINCKKIIESDKIYFISSDNILYVFGEGLKMITCLSNVLDMIPNDNGWYVISITKPKIDYKNI